MTSDPGPSDAAKRSNTRDGERTPIGQVMKFLKARDRGLITTSETLRSLVERALDHDAQDQSWIPWILGEPPGVAVADIITGLDEYVRRVNLPYSPFLIGGRYSDEEVRVRHARLKAFAITWKQSRAPQLPATEPMPETSADDFPEPPPYSPVLVRIPGASDIAWSPDGELVANAGYCGQVVDVERGAVLAELPAFVHARLCFSPDSRAVTLKNVPNEVVTVSVDGGHELARVQVAGRDGAGPVYSPCGNFVIISSREGRLTMLRAADLTEVWAKVWPLDDIREIHRSGDHALVTVHRTWIADDAPSTPEIAAELARRARLRVPRQGSCVYACRWRWPLDTAEPQEIPIGGTVKCTALAPDGRRLAISGREGTPTRIIDLDGSATLAEVVLPEARRMFWSPDGRRLAMTCQSPDRVVLICDDQFHERKRLHLHACALAWSPDCTRLAIGMWHGDSQVIDAPW
jgi:WD40 repeat protein